MGWPTRGSRSRWAVAHDSGRPCGQIGLSRRGRHGFGFPLRSVRRVWTGPNEGAVNVAHTAGWVWHHAPTSFYVLVSPLHTRAARDWIAGAAFNYGLPHQAPTERDLPTIKQVLSAFRQANCHGRAWFQLRVPSVSTD